MNVPISSYQRLLPRTTEPDFTLLRFQVWAKCGQIAKICPTNRHEESPGMARFRGL